MIDIKIRIKNASINPVDTIAYLLLLLAFLVGVLAFYGLRFDATVQFLVILTLVFFYLIWAVVYHLAKRDFTTKLFLEYLLIAAIAAVVGILVFIS